MPKTPEKRVKDAVVKLLKKYNAYYVYYFSYGMGRSGVPDILACVGGRFLAIECKAGNNKATPLQQRELDAVSKAQGVSLVINEDNLPVLEACLKEMLQHGTHVHD